MSAIGNNLTQTSSLAAFLASPPAAEQAMDLAPSTQAGVAHTGMGALAGEQISVGTSIAAPQPMAIAGLPPVVQSAAQGVKLQPTAAQQAMFARPAARPQPTPQISALYAPQPGGVATNAKVLHALHAQEKAAGTNLSPKEITGYVALGEQAFHAIAQTRTGVGKLLGAVVVNSVNPPVVLTPNAEVSRAIAWYVAACAVQQEVDQPAAAGGKGGAERPAKAASVLQDPGNAVYNFLQQSPLAYSRESPHGSGPSAGTGKLAMEDYDRRLPGKQGAIVFGKLQGAAGKEEMFFQLERSGRPEVSTSAQRVDDMGQGRASGLRAFVRRIQNSIAYVLGRLTGAQEASRPVDLHPRSPHLEKVHDELKTLDGRSAKAQGVLKPYSPDATNGTHTIPGGIYGETPKDWNRNGITIEGIAYPGAGSLGHIASHDQGKQSTLEQACSAFVKTCGGNEVAANWISRFTNQSLGAPLLEYLAQESLGTVGSGLSVTGTQSFVVNSMPDGAVEVTMSYLCEDSATSKLQVNDPMIHSGDPAIPMDAQARLHATVTLRFENLDTYTADKAPVPVISKPLTYTTSNFDKA